MSISTSPTTIFTAGATTNLYKNIRTIRYRLLLPLIIFSILTFLIFFFISSNRTINLENHNIFLKTLQNNKYVTMMDLENSITLQNLTSEQLKREEDEIFKPFFHTLQHTLQSTTLQHTLQNDFYSKLKIHNHLIYYNDDYSYASLHLQNVCLNYKGELIYLTTTELYEEYFKNILKIVNGEKVVGFIQNWLNGDRGAIKLNFLFLDKLNKNEELKLFKNVKMIEKPTVMGLRYASGNVGHMLVDNLAGFIELIKKFNFNPQDILYLYMDEIFYKDYSTNIGDFTCENKNNPNIEKTLQAELLAINPKSGKPFWCKEEMSSYTYSKDLSVKFSLQWTRILQNKYFTLQKCTYDVIYNKDDINTNKEVRQIHVIERAPCPRDDIKNRNTKMEMTKEEYLKKGNELNVCFKDLLLGTGERTFVKSRDFARNRELALFYLRKEILKNIGVLQNTIKNIKDKEIIKIGIHDKPFAGSHGCTIGNINEIINYLKLELTMDKIIPNNLQNNYLKKKRIEILPIKLEEYNLIEQVKLFSEIDLYISTPGSGSYYSLFLPENSHLIYSPVCIYDPVRYKEKGYICMQPVIHVHTTMSHLTVLDALPLVVGCKDRVGTAWCDAVLNKEGILNYVKLALRSRLL